ncbi:MAG TPA: hypothetical protein VN042_13460 [Asticcacaulis sp.]|nr:hypothetical protein [Asticcacaulis sp.]
MSPDRRRKGLLRRQPSKGPLTLDQATEQIIDAIDFLRAEMRAHGLSACADVLDDAFVACLDVYVRHKAEEAPVKPGPNGGQG